MDSFIYALVLSPALTELLPKSGMDASPANVGFVGSVLFALFLERCVESHRSVATADRGIGRTFWRDAGRWLRIPRRLRLERLGAGGLSPAATAGTREIRR